MKKTSLSQGAKKYKEENFKTVKMGKVLHINFLNDKHSEGTLESRENDIKFVIALKKIVL